MPTSMPACGEDAAPVFNKLKPRELPKFFDELEYLFERADIQRGKDKKRHTLRYVDFETEELWRAIPEFAGSYNKFKAAILNLYPDASEDNRYCLGDIDILIGERLRLGINSVNDLADFNTRFLVTTSWLIDRQQLSDLEQRRSYIRAFPPSLLTSILARLQIKFPNRLGPYKVSSVYNAALFVLRSTPTPVCRNQYSLRDMDILIGEQLRLGIASADGLVDFHKRFLTITNWLIEQRLLSDLEQQRSYIRAFPPPLLTPILTRLQIKFPDQHPDMPYKVSDIQETALTVLRFASTSTHPSRHSSPVTPSLPHTLPELSVAEVRAL